MSDKISALQQLGGLISAGLPTLGADVRDAAVLHVIDTVGAWVAGAATEEGRALIDFRHSLHAHSAGGLLEDVTTHCAVTRLSEIDDIHIASMTTPGAIIIPAALAIAVRERADPRAVLEAIVLGYESMVRYNSMVDGPALLYRGIWPTYFAAAFGVATVAARLKQLDAERTAHALALALTLSAPGVGAPVGATAARWLGAGNAARNGLFSALAAESGFTSDLRLIEGHFLPEIYNIKPAIPTLTDGWGRRAAILQTSFKPWCAARQTMAATQACMDIVSAGTSPDDISEIVAFVPPPHLRMVAHGVVRGNRVSFLTSLPYQIAAGMLAPETGFDVGKAQPVLTPAIEALMAKVQVLSDENLLDDYPKTWPARVNVTTRTGSQRRAIAGIPGDPDQSFDDAAVAAKFHRLAAPALGSVASANLLGLARTALDHAAAPAMLLDAIQDLYDRPTPSH